MQLPASNLPRFVRVASRDRPKSAAILFVGTGLPWSTIPRDFPLPPGSSAVTCASSHRYSQMLDPILRRWSRTPSDTGSMRVLANRILGTEAVAADPNPDSQQPPQAAIHAAKTSCSATNHQGGVGFHISMYR
jgi:hypothetical protein